MPTQRNIGPDRNGLRLSFHIYMDQRCPAKTNAIDPQGTYFVRLYAQRESPPTDRRTTSQEGPNLPAG
ncbi:MAG: hypothetical protein U0930_16075 [Pirellulales bacterium]